MRSGRIFSVGFFIYNKVFYGILVLFSLLKYLNVKNYVTFMYFSY